MATRQQYAQIQARYPEHVLFMKSDTHEWEAHFTSGHACAQVLGSTIHDDDTVYMPESRIDKAIADLQRAGYKVATMSLINGGK